jgi:transposase
VTTKIHTRVDGNGKPITFILSEGERHDSLFAEALMQQGAVKRPQRGRPRQRPKRVVADKAFGKRAFRQFLRRHGIRMTIPRKSNERRRGKFDKAVYRQRNQVERFFNRLKQCRRVATRYEKRAVNYQAMITLAAILIWL